MQIELLLFAHESNDTHFTRGFKKYELSRVPQNVSHHPISTTKSIFADSWRMIIVTLTKQSIYRNKIRYAVLTIVMKPFHTSSEIGNKLAQHF